MKLEYLILVPKDNSFCASKEAFKKFLEVDASISISEPNISYSRSLEGNNSVSAKFSVETGLVKGKDERFFLIALECDDKTLCDELAELGDKLKAIASRISPGSTDINTLWDDVGRIYAEKAYPLINETENLMRKLISKFMLINVGVNWSDEALHSDLLKKTERQKEDEERNVLYRLDFIQLKEVLFEKKSDISKEDLIRLLSSTKFSEHDKEKIKKFIPRSNWEKYFSEIIDDKDSSLEEKWKRLYELRNKVAHNRSLKREEFKTIEGLTKKVNVIINKAIQKLDKIDLDEEQRKLISEKLGENLEETEKTRLIGFSVYPSFAALGVSGFD